MTPLVSIIIPTYNRLDSLRRTLESIARQEGVPWEVLVVDDAGTDGTPEALEQLERVRVLVNETRQGPSVGRNRALAQARGEFVWFLDSDVVLPDERLMQRMVELFSVTPDAGSLGGEIVVHEEDRERAFGRRICWNARNVRVTARAGDENLTPCCYLATCNCFTRRDYARGIGGFDERFVFGAEDQDFGARLAGQGRRNYVRHDLAVLHYHEKRGRYAEETIHYQTTRIIYAKKHYGWARTRLMLAEDALRCLWFYLLLLPKLLVMLGTGRNISRQNLVGGWMIVSPYFMQAR